MKNRNLISRFGTLVILGGSVILITVTFIIYNFAKIVVLKNMESEVKISSLRSTEKLGYIANQANETVSFLENNVYKYSKEEKETENFLSTTMKFKNGFYAIHIKEYDDEWSTGHLKDILVVNNIGRIDTKDHTLIKKRHLLDNWYKNIIEEKETNRSTPLYIDETGEPMLAYATALRVHEGGIQKWRIINCIISIKDIINELENTDIYNSGYLLLVADGGQIVYHPERKYRGQKIEAISGCFDNNAFSSITSALRERESGVIIKIRDICHENRKSAAVSWSVSEKGLMTLAFVPRTEILAGLNKASMWLLTLLIISIALLVAVVIYLSKVIFSPISRLASSVRKLIEEEDTLPEPRDDISILTEGLNVLKQQIETYHSRWDKSQRDQESLNRELELARDIEMSMVPSKFPLYPNRTDFDCYGVLIPAKSVGGDFYDIYLLDDNQLFISICDTLGKGIPAAMFSVMTQTMLRSIASRNHSASKIVTLLNEELSRDNSSDMFVTVFLGILNLSTGKLTYCNAGHQHPFILKRNGKLEDLPHSHGTPVGIIEDQKFDETEVALKLGDIFIGYSDGITEEYNSSGQLFGQQRLQNEIQNVSVKEPKQIIEATIEAVKQHRGEHSNQKDDISMISVKYNSKRGSAS